MGKRVPYTPSSKIRQALRQLWLRSRERAAALKRDKYTCVDCGVKQTKKKEQEIAVCVHHRKEIEWDGVLEFIRERVLQTPDDLETLCKECHDKKHKTT